MKITTAAIQMPSTTLEVASNVERADDLIRLAAESGAELVVLPEMFNTGYGFRPDYGPIAEGLEGPTLNHLRARARERRVCIAAGFVERDGHHLHDALAFVGFDGDLQIYRKRHLVFWERYRFFPGRDPVVVNSPFGRIGLAICADMIYHRVWREYRDQIDMAVISAAWPDFADRNTGHKHWLFGHVGPLAAAIPGRVAKDLGIPVVFCNQVGETTTRIPVIHQRIQDCFAGRSSITDGHHGETVVAGPTETILLEEVTIHPKRGLKTWRSTSNSVPAGFFSESEQ